MKKTILVLAIGLLAGAANAAELEGITAAGVAELAQEQRAPAEVPAPSKSAFAGAAAGYGAVRLLVAAEGGIKVSASAVYAARKESHSCTEFSWNEGSLTRVPKRIYPGFSERNGLVDIPEAVDSSCDYARQGGVSLTLSIPGTAEAYNSVAVLAGGGTSGEQTVVCSVINAGGPSGSVKRMLNCFGDVRLDVHNQAKVRVVLSGEKSAVKSSPECPYGCGTPDPLDVSGDKLVEFGAVCELGKNPAEAVAAATLLLNQPVVRLQSNINVWTYATYSGSYLRAPYKVSGDPAVSKISVMAKYNWLACIPVRGSLR